MPIEQSTTPPGNASASRCSASSRSYGYGGGTKPAAARRHAPRAYRRPVTAGSAVGTRANSREAAGRRVGAGGPGPGCRLVVHLDEHLAGAVQRGEHVAAVVGHAQLDDAARARSRSPMRRGSSSTPRRSRADTATDPRSPQRASPHVVRRRRRRSCSTRAARGRRRRRSRAAPSTASICASASGVPTRRRRARAGRRRRPPRASTGTPRRAGAAAGARSRPCRTAARSRRRAGASRRVVGSSVENSWSSTSTPASVSRLSSVDLPAFV